MLAGDGPCVATSDLAAEIGIKSASVHHHFPTKATMAAAVARRYADRFFAAVARRASETADDAIAAYRSTFKAVVDRDGLMCLFGVLGAEAGGLSPEIASEVRSFFRRCIEDLSHGSVDPMRKRGPFRSLPRSKAAWCSPVPIKITKCSTRPLPASGRASWP